jgi:ABC-type transport system substrate-binding protein
VRKETTIDFMSWLGIKARMDYLPIAQEYLRKLGFRSNVDIIDNALIDQYINGSGPRGKDHDFHVLLFGPGVDPQHMGAFVKTDADSNYWLWGLPEEPNPDTGKKEGPVYDNPRIVELFDLAAAETDDAKRTELFQEIDCIWNEEWPFLATAAASFISAKSTRMQGLDWDNLAGLGNWTQMYKPGDWWIWEH